MHLEILDKIHDADLGINNVPNELSKHFGGLGCQSRFKTWLKLSDMIEI